MVAPAPGGPRPSYRGWLLGVLALAAVIVGLAMCAPEEASDAPSVTPPATVALEARRHAGDDDPAPDEVPAPGDADLVIRVVSAVDGAPLQNATVYVANEALSPTDAAGLTWTPARERLVAIRARADHHATASAGAPPGPGRLEIALLRRTVIRGRVLDRDSGAPVANARVVAIPGTRADYDQDRDIECRSDASGSYVLEDAKPGFWTVFVIGGTHVSLQITQVRRLFSVNPLGVTLTPATDLEHDLVVVPSRPLTGRVVDPDGQPVSGVRVGVWCAADSSQIVHRRAKGVSGVDGRFVVEGLLPGRISVRPDSPTHAWSGPADYLNQGLAEDVTLVVRPKPVLRVRVTTTDGTPIEGANVGFSKHSHVVFGLGSARTDATGEAAFATMAALPVRVGVSAEGFADARGDIASLDEAPHTIELSVAPSAPSTDNAKPTSEPTSPMRLWEVRVVTADGDPVDRAWARVTWEGGGSRWRRHGFPVSQGRVWIEAPETAATLDVLVRDARDRHGERAGMALTHVPELRPEAPEIRMLRSADCEGLVTGADGAPLAGIRIDVKGPHLIERETSTDAEGRFAVYGFPPGPVDLQVWQPDQFADIPTLTWTLPVSDGRVVLRESALITLRIRGPDGKPASDITVFAKPRGGGRGAQETSDETGTVVLEGLVAGELHELSLYSWRNDELLDLIEKDWVARDEDIELGRGYVFHGTLVDEAGRLLPGIRVAARNGDTRKTDRSERDGSFRIDSVAFADGELVVVLGDSETVVPARAGADTRITVAVGPSVRIRYPTFEDAFRSLAGTARLFDEAARDIVWSEETLLDSTISGLDRMSTYAYYTNLGNGECAHLTGLRADGQLIEIVPTRAQSVGGRVELAGAKPRFRPEVTIDQGAVRSTATMDSAGRYSLGGLPAGTWTVRVRHEHEGVVYVGEVQSPSGGEDVVLELRPE